MHHCQQAPVAEDGPKRCGGRPGRSAIKRSRPDDLAAEVVLTIPQPVSAAIDLRSERLRAAAKRALAAIDRVHLAAGLPRIPLDTRRDDPRYRGHYRVKRNSGRALGIGIDPTDRLPEMTILHEIGHFIDHQALGDPGSWASTRHLELLAWRQTVAATSSINRLHEFLRLNDLELALITGSGKVSQHRDDVRYLLAYTETWARSYAQYIIVRSGEQVLLDQLATERTSGDVIWDLGQWSDEDFEPLATVIEALFRRKDGCDEPVPIRRSGLGV